MYHYTESGLTNVWLSNGYNVFDTPYGKGVSIEDADGLHKMLAIRLTEKEGRLTGKEFRFLRTLLCLSQKRFAEMVGVTEQSASLWERTGKVPTAPDSTLRMLVLEKFTDDGKMSKILERINTVDRLVNQQIVASERNHKWKTKAQADRPEVVPAAEDERFALAA